MAKKRPPSRTRQVRFSSEQDVQVCKKAEEMRLPVSTFIRLCALSGAGLAATEVTRLQKITQALESIGAIQAT